ncbi:MAG: 2-nitropropane dioxygenase [Nitrospina sp.]|nr:2-nitropropane dioxygenase [Nitrospina sp.]MBT3511123.1 2-nitropropane dioxygenase [Nitrospina sp.]MBT3877055.1 2-nitropropane dioxygenase [Nitrospina sp.]MBT4048326.1 2-nitropropane dioxygenase [Nitrospina sp.]MBT4558229.1 2-nitropropane dioxygenase [Nitrospina sp.]
MGSKKLDVLCPCCETKLQVDQKTGEVIWEERKPKPEVSLTDMVKDLEHQKKEQESLFKKNSANQKERGRVLDEIFKESQKHVDKSGEKPLRDFDLD